MPKHIEQLKIKNVMLAVELEDGRIFYISGDEAQSKWANVTLTSEVMNGERTGEQHLHVGPLLGSNFVTQAQMNERIQKWQGIDVKAIPGAMPGTKE